MYSGQAWPQGRYKPLRADRNVQLDITRHIPARRKPGNGRRLSLPAELSRTPGRLDRLRGCRALSPQFFQIVELAHLRPEHVDDHVSGVDQHPIAIGQALDVQAFDSVFFQTFGDVIRNRADVPVGPARCDDHVVGKCGFAAKVYGDRFFRLHIREAGEDHIQRLVGVGLRLQGRGVCRCFTRSG